MTICWEDKGVKNLLVFVPNELSSLWGLSFLHHFDNTLRCSFEVASDLHPKTGHPVNVTRPPAQPEIPGRCCPTPYKDPRKKEECQVQGESEKP